MIDVLRHSDVITSPTQRRSCWYDVALGCPAPSVELWACWCVFRFARIVSTLALLLLLQLLLLLLLLLLLPLLSLDR